MSDATLKAMQNQIDALTRQVERLEDVNAIRHLHYAYGYYIDKCLYDDVVELFSDSGEARFLNGIYRGRAGARRLYSDWFGKYFTGGKNAPVYGFLLDHLELQDIIDVAPDRKTAKARFRGFLMGGSHKTKTDAIPGLPSQFWEGGIYENEYVRENGVWKIRLLNYVMLWQANYEEGWAGSDAHLMALTKTYPEDPNGPDELMPTPAKAWPHTRVVPFHYAHPVTGKPHAVR